MRTIETDRGSYDLTHRVKCSYIDVELNIPTTDVTPIRSWNNRKDIIDMTNEELNNEIIYLHSVLKNSIQLTMLSTVIESLIEAIKLGYTRDALGGLYG